MSFSVMNEFCEVSSIIAWITTIDLLSNFQQLQITRASREFSDVPLLALVYVFSDVPLLALAYLFSDVPLLALAYLFSDVLLLAYAYLFGK